MEVFQTVKIVKAEALRIASVEFAIQLHNFRTDVTRDTEKVINDAKRINTYLELGT